MLYHRGLHLVCSVDESKEDAIRTVAEEIRAYLESNPNAADTLQGIATWWYTRARYEETQRTVKAALDYLLTEGAIRTRKTTRGEIIYYRTGRGSEG